MKKALILLLTAFMLAFCVNAEPTTENGILRYDFDDMDGISFYRADGETEEGILVVTPNTPTSNGKFDHGIFLEDLGFDASEYDSIKIRMKRDRLENLDPNASRPEWLQIYFLTETEGSFKDERGVSSNLKTTIGEENLSDWFEVELKLSSNALWKGTIPRMRIDTTDNNGVYYIDYVELSGSTAAKAEEPLPEEKEEPEILEISFNKVNKYNGNFTDVAETAWYAANVKEAFELGFMNGKSEGKFDPNGNVTVAEGITMATRLHAISIGSEVSQETASGSDTLRYDFDTMDGITLNKAVGETKDGLLVMRPDAPLANGSFDHGFFLDGLDMYATTYDTFRIRLKRDKLDNTDPNKSRPEWLQVYFQTINDLNFKGERGYSVNLKKTIGEDKLSDWFEIEIKLPENALWKDTISRMRIDPTDNNGIYYIDYLEFSKSGEKNVNEKWYDLYVSYALKHNIIKQNTFATDEYTRNITRAEMCNLFAAALPESYFAPINKVTAIPDMDKNDYYADIMLMLYRAGIVLGSDAEGNFNASSDIKRSEVAAIINRVALPENRVKGEISGDWASSYHMHDIEFDDVSELDELYLPESSSIGEIKDGHLVLIPVERKAAPTYDAQVGKHNVSIRADEYTTLRVRMKIEYKGTVGRTKGEFFFIPEGTENFAQENGYFPDFEAGYYVDAAGWRVYDFYLGGVENWKGNITGFRFDPTNNNGVYTIDYIRFVREESTMLVSDEELEKNYTATKVFEDEGFENGFIVKAPAGDRNVVGTFTYGDETKEPKWYILPWWTKACFINDAAERTDKYTIADNIGAKTFKYNPDEKSVTMRLDTEKVYEGKAHGANDMWPHLLVEQTLYADNYSKVPEEKKASLDLGADKVYVEMEVKLNELVDLDAHNRQDGVRSHIKYNVYFYVAHKDVPGTHTYFGVNPLDTRGNNSTKYDWFKDSESIMMIYRVPASDFITEENALGNDDGTYNMGEWKKVRVDITPHLENIASLLTKDNTLKRSVTRDDLWMSGVNAGFEIWGNWQCEVEMRNLNVICYDKK